MTARRDHAPQIASQPVRRGLAARGRWQCCTCGDILEGTYAAADRHADGHGGARLEAVILPS